VEVYDNWVNPWAVGNGGDQRGRRTVARLAGIRADHDSRERSGHIHRDQGDGFADAI